MVNAFRVFFVIAVLACVGCGQKGDLYLDNRQAVVSKLPIFSSNNANKSAPKLLLVPANTVFGELLRVNDNRTFSWQEIFRKKTTQEQTTDLIYYAVPLSDIFSKPPIDFLIGTVRKAQVYDRAMVKKNIGGYYLRFRSVREYGAESLPALLARAKNYLKDHSRQRGKRNDFIVENKTTIDLYIATEGK